MGIFGGGGAKKNGTRRKRSCPRKCLNGWKVNWRTGKRKRCGRGVVYD